MPNKRYFADQVKFRLAEGWPNINDAVLFDDVYAALAQKINAMFHVEHFSQTLATGETIPDYAAIALYQGIPVSVTSSGRSQCTLPVNPISLPRNMGIFEIQDPLGNISFIPLLPTQRILLQSQSFLSDLLGQVGYTPIGRNIEFTKNVIPLGTTQVNLLLVIMDITKYSDFDDLPVPASMEQDIIIQLVNEFAGVDAKADAKKEVKP